MKISTLDFSELTRTIVPIFNTNMTFSIPSANLKYFCDTHSQKRKITIWNFKSCDKTLKSCDNCDGCDVTTCHNCLNIVTTGHNCHNFCRNHYSPILCSDIVVWSQFSDFRRSGHDLGGSDDIILSQIYNIEMNLLNFELTALSLICEVQYTDSNVTLIFNLM